MINCQGDQVPKNVRAGPEKLWVSGSSELFPKPRIFQTKIKFSYFYGYFYEFDKLMHQKRANFAHIRFYDAKYQNLIMIFAAAWKNIFGKVVTLNCFYTMLSYKD